MTGLSLIVAHWQRSFLAICAYYKLLTQHCTRYCWTVHNVHSCGKVTSLTLDIVLESMCSNVGHAVATAQCLRAEGLHYSASYSIQHLYGCTNYN